MKKSSELSDVNTQDKHGWTNLHHAATLGQFEEVRRLVERGADVNIRNNKDGWAALIAAAVNGHGDIVQYLHQAGADINI